MNKSVWAVIMVIILIMVGVGISKDDEQSDGPIKIGVMLSLTGPFAAMGEEARLGILDAGVPEEEIEFIFEDTACENQTALSAFQKLTDINKVNFIIGPGCGSPQEIVASKVVDKDIVVIVPTAAARALHEVSGGKLYNIQYSLNDESKFIAEKFNELEHEKVVLITYQNAFSATHAESFREHFDGEIVADIVYTESDTDVSTELLKLRGKEFTAIYSPDLAFFFAQGYEKLKQLGFDQPMFIVYTAEFPPLRELVEGTIYAFPGDVKGGNGTFFELPKLAAQMLSEHVIRCDGDYGCVQEEIAKSGAFDEFGVREQAIVLKKIVNGEAVMFEN